jgi:hypothetical protein
MRIIESLVDIVSNRRKKKLKVFSLRLVMTKILQKNKSEQRVCKDDTHGRRIVDYWLAGF